MELESFDEAYLKRLRAAEPATCDHFVAYFGKLLFIKLRSRLRSPQAIEDIRQETFARVFTKLILAVSIRFVTMCFWSTTALHRGTTTWKITQ